MVRQGQKSRFWYLTRIPDNIAPHALLWDSHDLNTRTSLQQYGATNTVALTFDKNMAEMSAEDFIQKIIIESFDAPFVSGIFILAKIANSGMLKPLARNMVLMCCSSRLCRLTMPGKDPALLQR